MAVSTSWPEPNSRGCNRTNLCPTRLKLEELAPPPNRSFLDTLGAGVVTFDRTLCALSSVHFGYVHPASSPKLVIPPELAVSMLVEFELIERARSGDEGAFNQVVQAYRKRILGTIARLIGRPEDVEDVGQEVFLRLYYSLEQLRTPEVFEPWLYRLTVNAAYDYLRRKRRRHESRMSDLSEQQVMMADAVAGGKANEEDNRRTKIRELVESLLEKISEEDRILLLMKEVEGLSLKELEQIYKVNENALKVRLFRARQRVLKALESKDS